MRDTRSRLVNDHQLPEENHYNSLTEKHLDTIDESHDLINEVTSPLLHG